jgi:hypothetical protein
MMAFVTGLAQDYQAGHIQSWEVMADRVHHFFTSDMLNDVEVIAPGWRAMSSYADGVTLVHVMCVFTGLLTSPEFQWASTNERELMKWIILFHDIAKEVRDGQRDLIHGFRSAARTGTCLPRIGFEVTAEYDDFIEAWFLFTDGAITRRGNTSIYIQDNRKLPEIIGGIERLFGYNTPAALVVKTVLLHMSINVVEAWPQSAPLSETEIRQYLDMELLPLLKMMMLADNDGWALFDQATKEQFRQETLAVFSRLESLLAS